VKVSCLVFTGILKKVPRKVMSFEIPEADGESAEVRPRFPRDTDPGRFRTEEYKAKLKIHYG
jgi:hypothetical protein